MMMGASDDEEKHLLEYYLAEVQHLDVYSSDRNNVGS